MTTLEYNDATQMSATIPGVQPSTAYFKEAMAVLAKDNQKCLRQNFAGFAGGNNAKGDMYHTAMLKYAELAIRRVSSGAKYECKLGSLNLGMLSSECCSGAATAYATAAASMSSQNVAGMNAVGIHHCS